MSLTDIAAMHPTPTCARSILARIGNLDYLIDLYLPHDRDTARRLVAERRRLIFELTGLTPEKIIELAAP